MFLIMIDMKFMSFDILLVITNSCVQLFASWVFSGFFFFFVSFFVSAGSLKKGAGV